MPLRSLLYLVLIFGTGLSSAARIAAGEDSPLQTHVDTHGVLITEDETPVLYFQRTNKSSQGRFTRANYVHPLYGLDGEILTEDFPSDHLHHRGVFWAWHQFRIGSQAIGDGWLAQNFAWNVLETETETLTDGSVRLKTRVNWHSDDWQEGKEPIAVERTEIHAHPRRGDRRNVDFAISIRATQAETQIGGSDDKKGYGGFSLRLRLPADIMFSSPRGDETPTVMATSKAPWMSMSGSLGNRPRDAADSAASSVTVLVHPDSADFEPTWILRSKRSMQNAVWPGSEPVPLPTDDTINLRYRVVVHRHPATSQTIDAWHQEFAKFVSP